jgi:hypothetical protein
MDIPGLLNCGESIADLKRDGRDTRMARELLATFKEMQRAHVADRDRLARELAEAG